MAKAPHIVDVDFTDTFRKNYRDYGMDVIKNRALPDIRDGLKPVHRAIMTEMLNSHNNSKNKTVKVARITGAVIGNWHPHGDKAVEDALAGLSLPWKNSMPPIFIKGNKGSVFGDSHAAGRYIEARLSPTGDAYGKQLKEGIVEYEPNFDETKRMPKILPAQLPYLLINGDEGIGVGFASTIPTHNPIEVINTFIRYVKKPKSTVPELMETLPGPDFFTKGEIINQSDIAKIYETGIGHLRVKGRMRYEKKSHTLHIYEIPATAAGAMDKLIDELTTATMETVDRKGKKNPPKIIGVNSVKDHSGKDGIDITIHLKRGADPKAIEESIFAKTKMETTFKFDFSALNNKQLKRYSLISYFKEYLAFQHQIVINEFTIAKRDLAKRMEVITGLLILQKVIDEVIDSARNANGKSELRDVLMHGKVLKGVKPEHQDMIKTFSFSELQAEHIANLPIYKINKLDYAGLVDEGTDIQKQLENADEMINNPTKRKNLIIKRHQTELKKLDVKEFARRTEIKNAKFATAAKLEIPETTLYVSLNKYHYLRLEEKKFEDSLPISNKKRLGFFDIHGVCWNLHLENEKPTAKTGVLVNQLLPTDTQIVGWSTKIAEEDTHYGLFVFDDGNAKLTEMNKFMTKSKSTKVGTPKGNENLVYMSDVPDDAIGVDLNGTIYRFDQFSINGRTGHGKHMIEPTDDVTVKFITDEAELPTKTAQPTNSDDNGDGVAYFDGSDKLTFDWTQNKPDENHQALFAISYPELLKSELLIVHKDGRAKRINGEQFAVNSKRQQIQSDKKGSESIYIGMVPETMLAKYEDGAVKRVQTELISKQGKAGGGVRAFTSDKHVLLSVENGENSTVPCVSLATQPKIV